jgi:hypothetical protein
LEEHGRQGLPGGVAGPPLGQHLPTATLKVVVGAWPGFEFKLAKNLFSTKFYYIFEFL